MKDLNISVVFHSSSSTFAYLRDKSILSSYLSHIFDDKERECFGLKNGSCLVTTESLGIILILNAFGSAIVAILESTLGDGTEIYVTVSADGYFFCWRQIDGYCIRTDHVEHELEVSCAEILLDRYLLLGWQNRSGGDIVDLWKDHKIEATFYEVVNGIVSIEVNGKEVVCYDNLKQALVYFWNEATDKLEFRLIRSEDGLNVRSSVIQREDPEQEQMHNYLFLTPGCTLVYLSQNKVLSSPFPRTEKIQLERNDDIYLFDSEWDFLNEETLNCQLYDNVLSESIIVAYNSRYCSLSVWSIRVPVRKPEDIHYESTDAVLDWISLATLNERALLSSNKFRVFFCNDIKSRRLQNSSETRGYFAVLLETQLCVFYVKRKLQDCSSEFKCSLLHRFHLPLYYNITNSK